MSKQLYESLVKLYRPDLFAYCPNGGCICIKEHESGAKVKGAELECHGQLLSIDNDFLQKAHGIYPDNTCTPELKHDCDGVLAVEVRGCKYLVFIELKSSYTKDNLQKAEKQLAASYLRVMSRLICIVNFVPDAYKKCGIIISHPLDIAEKQKIKRKQQIGKRLDRYDRQALTFATTCKKAFPLEKKYAQLCTLPVRKELLFDSLPIYHLDVSQSASQGRFNLEEILRKL